MSDEHIEQREAIAAIARERDELRRKLAVAVEALEKISSDQEIEVSYKPAVKSGKSYFDFCDIAGEALAKIKGEPENEEK